MRILTHVQLTVHRSGIEQDFETELVGVMCKMTVVVIKIIVNKSMIIRQEL